MKDISFIIPALNEQACIGIVLDSIHANSCHGFSYEIILVDNGSKDRTVEIAKDKGANVYVSDSGFVGNSRNKGAEKASGSFLVFLDADVCLTPKWANQIGAVIARIRQKHDLVTGSLCGISDHQNWIEKTWFDPRTRQKKTNYINSGHLIISRDNFLNLGGFNPLMETGEDYEFCARAREGGCEIINDPELAVVHLGYPKDLKSFFLRERWHARGDYRSLSTLWASKPAWICCSCLVAAGASLAWIWVSPEGWLLSSLIFLLYLSGISAVSAIIKISETGSSANSFFKVSLIYTVYFSARTYSLIESAFVKPFKK
jgi:glycosyltransferase involved in cell wall biosynthesis